MKLVNAQTLLQAITDLDRQPFPPHAAETWLELLEDVSFDDAMTAVLNHYAVTDRRITATDVLREAKRLHQQRRAALEREQRNAPRADRVGSVGRPAHVEAMLREARRRADRASARYHATIAA